MTVGRDELPQRLAEALRPLEEGRVEMVQERLKALPYEAIEVPRRRTPPPQVPLQVFRRDAFHCVYCGRRVIFTPTLQLLGRLYPQDFPFTPNWRGGQTHPAVILWSAVVDHVEPGAWGGTWEDIQNLATACNPCNQAKADLGLNDIGWKRLAPPADPEWDGLTRFYRPLWEIVAPRLTEIGSSFGWSDVDVAKERAYHEGWLRLVDTPDHDATSA